jgi:hypothetical protein
MWKLLENWPISQQALISGYVDGDFFADLSEYYTPLKSVTLLFNILYMHEAIIFLHVAHEVFMDTQNLLIMTKLLLPCTLPVTFQSSNVLVSCISDQHSLSLPSYCYRCLSVFANQA